MPPALGGGVGRARALSDVSVESEEKERDGGEGGAGGIAAAPEHVAGIGGHVILSGCLQQQPREIDPEQQRQMVREVLTKHGDPADPFDKLKVLEEAMLESERDICIYAGAIELLKQQWADAKRNGCCSVCARVFRCNQDYENCLEQLDIKIRETELARSESNVVDMYNSTRAALSSGSVVGLCNKPGGWEGAKMFQSRVSFNLRSGTLTELRNQKAECLQEQSCFACLRELRGTDVVSYLQRVDRNAFQMQERLHVHN